MTVITWREYQDFTIETALYRGAGLGGADEVEYCALGLGEESLEIAGPLLNEGPRFDRAAVFEECGDAAYYLAREYAAFGVYPKDIFTEAAVSPGFVRDHYLAFCHEASKAVGTVKKAMRKDGHAGIDALKTDPERRAKFLGYLDLTLAGLARLITSLDGTLAEALEMNRAKLLRRRETGTLHDHPGAGRPR
jgi:hypothetical protein